MAAVDEPQPSLHRNALLVFLTSVGALGIGYVASIVVARALGDEARGLIALMQVLAELAVTLVAAGTPFAVSYYASRRHRHRRPLMGLGLVVAFYLTVLCCALAWVFGDAAMEALDAPYDGDLWLLAALLVPAMQLTYWCTNMLRADRDFRTINLLVLLGRIATLIASVVFLLVLDLGVAWGIVCLLVPSLVFVAGALPRLLREGVGWSTPVAKAAYRYGVRVQVGFLLGMANGRLDLLILGALAPLAVVGHYAVAQIVAEIVLLVPMAIGVVLLPEVARARSGDTVSAAAIRLNGTTTLAAALGLALFGPLLITVGYGPEFTDAVQPFLILLPGMWFLSAGNLIAETLRGRGRPGQSSLLAAVALVVTVILDLLLIPPFSAVGGAIASTAAYTTYGLLSLRAVARLDGVPIHALLIATRPEFTAYIRSLRAAVGRLRQRG